MPKIQHVRTGLAALLCVSAALSISLGTPSLALSQQFGRNKVQHSTFNWHILATDHFDVHYYPEEREAAVRGAQILERCYVRMSTLLDHRFEEGKRKPAVFYATHAQFQETNITDESVSEGTGGFTDMLRQRLVMPIPANYAEFEHIICHELAHQFQFDIYLRRSEHLSESKNRTIDISMWFIEGMAEYLSIGRIDPRTHATMRDATLSEYLNELPSGYLAYRFGQALFGYIGMRYGDYAIGKILKRTMEVGERRGFSDAGVPLDGLVKGWMQYAKETYTPQLFTFQHPGDIGKLITNHEYPDIKRLIKEGRLDKIASYNNPALSPDGGKVVFISGRGNVLYGFEDYWLASAEDGAIIKLIVEGERSAKFESLRLLNSAPAWSYDGKALIFSAQHKGKDALYLHGFGSDKTRQVELPDETLSGIENPRFCGNDSRIVFTGVRGGHRDLYVGDLEMERSGQFIGTHFVFDQGVKNLTQLTNDPYSDLHPVCSLDGKFIAFASDRESGTDFDKTLTFGSMRIVLYDVATKNIAALPMQDEGENTNPVFSPDGKWIGFISDRTGIHNIFLWSLEEQKLYQLTNTVTGVMGVTALSPALTWASEANVIVFTYFEKQGSNLYRIDNPQAAAKPYDPSTVVRPLYPAVPFEKVSIPVRVMARRDSVCKAMTAQEKGKLAPDHACAPNAEKYISDKRNIFSDSALTRLRNIRSDSIVVRVDSVLLVPDGFPTIAQLRKDPLVGLPAAESLTSRQYKSVLSLENVCGINLAMSIGGPYGFNVMGYGCAYWSDLMRDRRVITELGMFGRDILNDSYLSFRYLNLKHTIDRGFTVAQYPYYRYLGGGFTVAPDTSSYSEHQYFVRDVYRAGEFVLQKPFSGFKRIEGSVSLGMIDRTLVEDVRTYAGYQFLNFDHKTNKIQGQKFVGISGAYVFDNALPAFVDYVDGARMRFGFRQLVGELQVAELSADARKYFNLGGRWAIASRLFSIHRMGRNAPQFVTYWGYESFIRGYGSGSFNLACAQSSGGDPFGYSGGRCAPSNGTSSNLIGSSAAFANLELRGPLFNPIDSKVAIGAPPLGFAIFIDAGAAYNSINEFGRVPLAEGGLPGTGRRTPMISYGAELRTRLGYMNLRFGYALTPSRSDRRGGFYFSFMPVF